MTFSAMKLKNSDMMSKSDPFLVLTLKTPSGFKELLRTEIVANNLNPKWVNSAYVSYTFDEIQDLQVCQCHPS
jgi:Ca2+-dependent lipid-binding protein